MFQSILPSSATPFLHYQPSINYQPFTGSVLPNCSSRIFITELSTTEFLIRFPPILSLINELKLSIESSKGIYPTSIPSSPIIPPSIVSNDYSTSNQLRNLTINPLFFPCYIYSPLDWLYVLFHRLFFHLLCQVPYLYLVCPNHFLVSLNL